FSNKRIAAVVTRELPVQSEHHFALSLDDVESWTGNLTNKSNDRELHRGSLFTPGAILFGKLRPYLAKVWVSDRTGVYIGDFISVRTNPDVHPTFLSYVFRTESFIHRATSESHGSKMPRIEWERIKNLEIPVPSLNTQHAIIKFLDRETAEIDAFIADQERLIELLEERRTATITHAVTKGLNPDAPMKDSGVESLGFVPAGWDVVSISRFVRFKNGSDYKQVEIEDGGYPVIGSGGEFRRALNYLFDGESVLFGRKGTVDQPLYISGKFWTVDTMYYTEIDDRYVLPKFLYYWALRIPFELYLTNTALPSMTQTDLGSAKIGLPLVPEQKSIVSALDAELAEIDAAVADAREVIGLLRERRAALISAAVTGQIDVTRQAHPVVDQSVDDEVWV